MMLGQGFRLLGVLALLSVALVHLSLADEGVAQVQTQPLNSARILASKHPLSQYAVENMDYVIEYHLYNTGDKAALRVSLDDRNSFPTQSFQIVKGQLQVRWEKIEPGENVTHSVIVRPRTFGTFNYTSAQVTYYPTEAAKEAKVGFTTAPGEGHIYRFKDYDRRFSSKISVWVVFVLLALPTTVVPFAIWWKLSKKYAANTGANKKSQ